MPKLIANWAGMADQETTTTALAEIEATLDKTVIAWSGETTCDMSIGDGISFSISGPDVYVSSQAQNGSAGAGVGGVSISGWGTAGHVHTIYRDPVSRQCRGGPDNETGPPLFRTLDCTVLDSCR